MKKIIAIVLVLATVLVFAGCGENKSDSGKDLKEITVCLDWTPNTNHTGLYVAVEKGYYEAAGLSVSIVQPPENGATLMCASGEAQFAIDAQDTLAPSFTSDSPLGITAVAALLQHNTSGIISRKGEGMDKPAGMQGKTYSTWESPVELAMLEKIVTDDGGDFSKVNLIPNVITDEAGALANHDTDAIWVFYGWGCINAELVGFDFDFINFADSDPVFDYYTPVLIANNDFLADDPDTAKAFLDATRKGYEFAIENPEEAAKILVEGDTTGSLNDALDLVTESQKWISKQYVADSEKWGYISPERWDAFYGWLWDNELIPTELPAGTGYSNDYLS